jgi:NADPH-ferrihemoprotein reductase
MAAPFRSGSGTSAASPFIATISEVRELHTAASDRSCVHVEIDISGAKGLSYTTGDHVAIYAENSPEVVEEVAGLLGLPLDTVFKLARPEDGSRCARRLAAALVSPALVGHPAASGLASYVDRWRRLQPLPTFVSCAQAGPARISTSPSCLPLPPPRSSLAEPLPGPITLRDALAYFADVLSSPHKGNLVALAAAAADAEERAKLLRLAGPQGKAEYQEYVAKPHRSLLEVGLLGTGPAGVAGPGIARRWGAGGAHLSRLSAAWANQGRLAVAVGTRRAA